MANQDLSQEIVCGDAIEVLRGLSTESAQIILADPPYNIGKDFGNDSDRQKLQDYLVWCDTWINESLRVLKPNGTMFIYGFSEILALILSRIPLTINRRWLVWHYKNKTAAGAKFWNRSHESIIVLWKNSHVFHLDDIREPYTEAHLKSVGRTRTTTTGRYSTGTKETAYTAHPNGAMPRDVITIPALAGGSGHRERVNHPTQKPLTLCERLLKSCQQGPTGGLVVVPFAGSGSECVAAKQLGLPFLGIELNPEYVALSRSRVWPPQKNVSPE